MSDPEPALRAFDVLVGSWTTRATHPQLDDVVSGTADFAWLDGGRFLVLRVTYDSLLVPDALAVIGAPEQGEGLAMEYFDSRGVRRTYRTAVEHGVWRWWRDAEGFAQRFTATLGADSFEGHGELALTPGAWGDDLSVVYRRVRTGSGTVLGDATVVAQGDRVTPC